MRIFVTAPPKKGKPATDHPKPVGPATALIGEMDEAIDKDRSRKR